MKVISVFSLADPKFSILRFYRITVGRVWVLKNYGGVRGKGITRDAVMGLEIKKSKDYGTTGHGGT
jgi:hypothetical protein